MMLNEPLEICLLALNCRYPESVVEINREMLDNLADQIEICSPTDFLVFLENNAPHLLNASACLIINGQKSELYLLERSEEVPAFRIYLGGVSPAQRSKQIFDVRTMLSRA